MNRKTFIFGHKNPDTDTVSAAISLSYLRNNLGEDTCPYVLDEVNKETQFVLDYFKVETPPILKDVRIQIKDLDYDKIFPFRLTDSIYDAYTFMNEKKIRTLPIVYNDSRLAGIVTMKDIAMSLVQQDQQMVNSSYENIVRGIEGKAICKFKEFVKGNIIITAYHLSTIEKMHLFQKDSIVITGDRYEIIEAAVENNVALIIITGNRQLSDELLEKAKKSKVSIISSKSDTYKTSKRIYLTNYVSEIMVKGNILHFKEEEYLDECKEIISKSNHSKFPVLDQQGNYLGILGRGHIINPNKKKVILVDHNEYAQSAQGIEQGEILEVIDHHKIGDISTSLPISFRNSPVGSTNTIIYQMYKENGIELPYSIAGIMLSGIISDTLLLKSPTTTPQDRQAVKELTEILTIDLEKFAMEMFRKGTDISGKEVKEVFFSDYKEFVLEGSKVGISQVFTLNIESIKENIVGYLELIKEVNLQKGQFITLLLVTDIIRQGSYVFYNDSKDKVIELAFSRKIHQGAFIENCVSRKKQILPMLIRGIRNAK